MWATTASSHDVTTINLLMNSLGLACKWSIVLPIKRQPSLPRNERKVQGFNAINQKRCYNCNATGHFSRNCPVRGRAVPAESHGRSNHNKSSRDTGSKKVATIVSENSKAQNEGKERITALRKAEIDESLKESSTMINVLSSIEGNKNEVGPTLTAEVEVEGKTVKALLDTGSPVTILSVDLLFNHWAQHKKAEQTVEE